MVDRAFGILFRDGCILLGRRAPDREVRPDCWDVIGGKAEPGEALEAALAREIGQEIGVAPTAFTKLATLDDPCPERHGEGRSHLYLVTAWTGEPAVRDAEHTALRWFTIDEACALPDLGHEACRALFRGLGRTPEPSAH
jgi:8-oxo-dGTP pyrophosphatase MutT (NUDIX family)